VLSWVALRGKCRTCHTPISSRYPLIELLTGVLFVLAAAVIGPHWYLVIAFAVLTVLVASSGIAFDSASSKSKASSEQGFH
jgi:leader peptidase (prepilin peptidase)/N-methyltransferase